eukprot:3680757-Amphidinium_carterae.3
MPPTTRGGAAAVVRVMLSQRGVSQQHLLENRCVLSTVWHVLLASPISNPNTRLERCGIACEEVGLRRLQAILDESSFHAMWQHERDMSAVVSRTVSHDERLVSQRLQQCYEAAKAVSLQDCGRVWASTDLISRVPTVLAQMLISYARSVGQTRIIEEGNQKIRDTEIWKSAGKAMQCLSIWDSEAGSAVIEE